MEISLNQKSFIVFHKRENFSLAFAVNAMLNLSITMEILPVITNRVLLQTKHKETDKTLSQCFLEELNAAGKISSESELKQLKTILNAL